MAVSQTKPTVLRYRLAINSCFTAIVLLGFLIALTAAAYSKPDSPESVAALKAIGAVLELNEEK